VGWALGVERIVGLLQSAAVPVATGAPQVYLVLAGDAAEREGLRLAEQWRDAMPGLRLQTNLGGGGVKAQIRRADRSGATVALILGEDELARGVVTIKPLRADVGQLHASWSELPARLRPMLD